MTSTDILNMILAQVKTLEGGGWSDMAADDFGDVALKSLKMDSLSLLELGIEVSNESGMEVDFLELGADLTMREVADQLVSAGG